MGIPAFVAVVMAAGLGCSGGAATTADGGTGAAGTGGGGNGGSQGSGNGPVGAFTVSLIEATATAAARVTLFGKVFDGATPQAIVWEQAAKEGDCTLRTPRVPFCDPQCMSATCVADNTCQADPASQALGTVTVTGLKTEAGTPTFTMTPISNGYQPAIDIKLVFPPFDEGADVTIQTGGGAYAQFMMQAKGIAPLVLLNGTVTAEKNKPLALTWTPPGKAGSSTIHVKLDLSHHGGVKGLLECDIADTGSFTISAALMTQLINLGLAGFPLLYVIRSAVGSTAVGQGHVDLKVAQTIEREITVPGLISCFDTTASTDCPTGKICQTDLTCK